MGDDLKDIEKKTEGIYLSDLNISGRLCRNLQRAGFNTLYEVICLEDERLLSIRNIGQQSFKEIAWLKKFVENKSREDILSEFCTTKPSEVKDGTILEYIAGKRGKYVYSIVDDKKHVKDDVAFPDTLSKTAQRIIKNNGFTGVRQVAEMNCSDFFVIKMLGEQTAAEIISYIREHIVFHGNKSEKNKDHENAVNDLFAFLDIAPSKSNEYLKENTYIKLEKRLEEKERKNPKLEDIIYLATSDPLYSILSKKIVSAVKKKNGISVEALQDSFFRLLNIKGLFESLLDKLSEDKKISVSNGKVSLYVMTEDEWIRTLPERERRLLELKKAGKSYNDIALEEGISRQRVGQLITGALKKKPATLC